jgi:glycolate oxidase iron-sulfur subunit
VIVSIDRELRKCSKCGKCRNVCPVFLETKSEGMVARGRISLAEAFAAGEIQDSAKLRQYLWGCLKCLRCADACPSGVKFDKIISEMRRRVGARAGLPWMARFSMRLISTRRRLFNFLVRIASLGQRLLPRRREGKVRHLPLMLFDGRGMPEIAPKSVLGSFADYYGAPRAEKKVALFVGCLINYAYPEVAEAMVKVLNHFRVGVFIPKRQVCCGTPALSLGDEELAVRLARMNVEAFRGLGVDAIICGCASGGATLKGEYPELLSAKLPFGAPVMDFSEFVAPLVEGVGGHFDDTVAWHDPCHLKYVQKISKEPRQILSQVADFEDFDGADYCCGMGGVFSVFFPELSMKIAARKVDAIEKAAPDVLATGCAGCMLQLRDRLAAKESSVRVMHIAEVIAAAIENERPHEPAAEGAAGVKAGATKPAG